MTTELDNKEERINSRFGFVSTTTTTINSTLYKTSYIHHKEKTGVNIIGNIANIHLTDLHEDNSGDVIDLISEQPKVFVTMTTSYYHLYHDSIGEFLTQYELMPDAKFIIDITLIAENDKLPPYIKMFFKALNDKKIDYRPINLRKFNKININNFYYRNSKVESLEINNPSPKVRKFFQPYVSDSSAPANKKVFLSRTNFQGRDLSILIKGRLPYENDNRIDDEGKLQEYFKNLGFEIVVPEDFKTFEDQINYFDKVKVLVSTTSSGFTNACFMRPGGTMIELTTPLISFGYIGNGVTQPPSQGQEEIHHFYHMMSTALDHNFISIPNKERNAQKIIDAIEQSSMIKYILSKAEDL